MADGGGINLRIALKGADEVKAGLRSIGPEGSRMARELDRSMRQPSRAISALDNVVAGARGELAAFAGPLGGLGPVGIAAGAGLAAAGLAAAAAAVQFREAASWAAGLTDVADRIGVSVEALQELRYGADEAGVPIEAMESGLERLNASLGAFLTGVGDGKVKAAFAKLGISEEDLSGVDTAAELLPIVADRLKDVQTQAERVQLLKRLGIAELEPMLRNGGDALRGWADEGRDAGLVIGKDLVNDLDQADRALEKNQQKIDANVRAMQAVLAPFWVWVSDQAAKAARAISNLFVHTESEQLQAAINLRARIERGQRANGRPLDTRTKGIYDRAGRDAEEILERRRQRAAAEPTVRDDAVDRDRDRPSVGGGAGGGNSAANAAARAAREAERVAEQAKRRSARVDDEIYRAKSDQLRAAIDITRDMATRQKLEQDGLALQQSRDREELAAFVAEGEIADAKKAELQAALTARQTAEQQAQATAQRLERERALSQAQRTYDDLQGQILSTASSMASTSDERRQIELQLLSIAQERMKADLRDQIAAAESAEARQRLVATYNALPVLFAGQRGEVERRTAGPVEAWQAEQAKNRANAGELIQQDALDALDGLNSGLVDAFKNAQGAGDAFRRMGDAGVDALGRVADALMEIALQRLLIQPLADSLLGGGTGGGGGLLSGFLRNLVGSGLGGSGGAGKPPGDSGGLLPGALMKGLARGGVQGARGLVPVGEYGMELMDMPAGARIYDTERTERMMRDSALSSSRGLSAAMSSGGASAPTSVNTTIKIVNQTSEPVRATTRPIEGGFEVLLDAVVDRRIASAGSDGSLSKALSRSPRGKTR